jgi:hypothetical protein
MALNNEVSVTAEPLEQQVSEACNLTPIFTSIILFTVVTIGVITTLLLFYVYYCYFICILFVYIQETEMKLAQSACSSLRLSYSGNRGQHLQRVYFAILYSSRLKGCRRSFTD